MRFEAKTETDAVEQAARALKRSAADVKYRVVRDEKSFWGGRIVEIEVDEPAAEAPRVAAAGVRSEQQANVDLAPSGDQTHPASADLTPFGDQTRGDDQTRPADQTRAEEPGRSGSRARREGPTPLDEDSYAAVESALSELLSTAGFLVETRRRSSSDEMVIELIGDDVEPLLANKGEGLNGLEVLTGRIASRRLGHPSTRGSTPRDSARTRRTRSRSSRSGPRTKPSAPATRSSCRRSRPESACSSTSRSPRTRTSRRRARAMDS